MTTSYLTTMLLLKAAEESPDAFLSKYPHHWMVWEPGAWKPPETETLRAPKTRLSAGSGEALAFVLKTKPGKTEMTLGRARHCDMEINDGTLSSLHMKLSPSPTGWNVCDAGSKNGLELNGVRLPPNALVPLANSHVLTCGRVRFTYHTPDGMLRRLLEAAD